MAIPFLVCFGEQGEMKSKNVLLNIGLSYPKECLLQPAS